MTKQHTVKFFILLGPRDMAELEKLFGRWIRNKWWYREWLRLRAETLALSAYRQLMETPPRAKPRPVRDWGDDPC